MNPVYGGGGGGTLCWDGSLGGGVGIGSWPKGSTRREGVLYCSWMIQYIAGAQDGGGESSQDGVGCDT